MGKGINNGISKLTSNTAQPLQPRPSGRVNINFHAIKFNLCNHLLCIDNLHIDICLHMLDYAEGTVVTLPEYNRGVHKPCH